MTNAKVREAIRLLRAYFNNERGLTIPADEMTSREAMEVVTEVAERTLPRTKEVEVWHVEYVLLPNLPAVNVYRTHREAQQLANGFKDPVAQCVRVTGPHKQQVPA
jgi:hypothetical protein